MKLKFFDWEVYPDWWCCVVSDEEPTYSSSAYKYKFTLEEETQIKDKMRVYTSDGGTQEIKNLIEDTKVGVLTGYNSKRYDLIMHKCISMHFTPRQMYIASQIVVEKVHEIPKDLNATAIEIARISNYVKSWAAKWQDAEATQDLMDDSDKGLKDKEASYGMDIRETTVPFGTQNLTTEQKAEIIYYCKHDVFALHVHYIVVAKPYIDTKLSLGKTYDISEKVCYASTNAVLSSKVLGAERVSGTTIKDPTIIIYQEPIRNYIEKWAPREALHHLYTSQGSKTMTMFGNKVSMADGGIHSTFITPKVGKVSSNLYVEANEDYGLYNIDLAGCHPSVMLFVGAMPRGITKPERFKESVIRRRKLKKTPKSEWTEDDKIFVPAGKLIHNTTYGASGNKNLPLYDDYMRSKVCRVSQMIIIAVAMNIFTTIPDVKIIQTNTDGILVYMKRTYLNDLKALIKVFEDLSQFEFELEEIVKIWQPNVNNYISIDLEGKPKLKGKSYITSIYQPGYNKVRPLGNHVIAQSQFEFYVNKKNPILYLLEHTVVADFCLTATKGPTYSSMIQETSSGDIVLGKVARVVGVTNPNLGEVRKIKGPSRDLVANCPPHALVVNDALINYTISGPRNNRVITHLPTGKTETLDMSYYVDLLDKALDEPWYKLYKNNLTFTTEFNLGGE